MASIKEAVNTAGTFTITVASLANGSSRQCTLIDNSTNLYEDVAVMFKIKTGTGTSSTGTIDVYAIGKVGSIATDNAGANDAAITILCANHIGTIQANADATTYYAGPFTVAKGLDGWLGVTWGIAIKNNSGAALDATAGNHSISYQEFFHTVA